ncbi:hypothetical protein E2C01_006760 [Portunus trituberculatus]|uniref:Uncharacterized protein n=1 Tax=Portunus trituberculatus TaxID=210409 RepID=A0A5B7CVZ2_PORTR|nr:hypothetical protein [Portunus trituberculatus]
MAGTLWTTKSVKIMIASPYKPAAAAKLHSPIKRSTKTISPQQIKEVICVAPPTASWINERDREAAMGPHPKKDPKTLLIPCKNKIMSSCKRLNNAKIYGAFQKNH